MVDAKEAESKVAWKSVWLCDDGDLIKVKSLKDGMVTWKCRHNANRGVSELGIFIATHKFIRPRC